jgi:hypothetical protein
MSSHRLALAVLTGPLALAAAVFAAVTVPTDVQQPGTQPGEVGNLERPDRCDNCHGGYDTAVEPAFNWRGSAMAQAARDPLFWATVAVAEQDFDGAGDLCLRCHTPEGWLGGRSTPTDGSGLVAGDADGVSCDVCHKLTNPDRSEHLGVQNPPFLAHDEQSPPTGYYGSGMYVFWSGNQKLGPYAAANPPHQFLPSRLHRDSRLCGTCHDVSNPVVGDLAPGNGAPSPLPPGTFSGVPGTPVDGKAAFNNFPYQYGVVERTFSEHFAGALSETRVGAYPTLPAELQAGAIQTAYQSALAAGTGGDYEDGTPRTFTCQSCHVRPVIGQGCSMDPPVRADLPLHDMTGGNYWLPDALQWLDARGLLRLGGGLTAVQTAALAAARARALEQLAGAASLSVSGQVLRVVNLTGHKLITGYPEGRRMWLHVRWYGPGAVLLREDGAYGPMTVLIDGVPRTVETLLDLDDPHGRVYEAHYAIRREWAARLLELGVAGTLPLVFDRETGAVETTLAEAAALPAGSAVETFHFALNDHLVRDNRIPPWGMAFDVASARNALPVPASQYGAPGPGGVYLHYDEVTLAPPAGAQWAEIRLLYQPTSWEYVQFLYLANTRQNPFLANEGVNLLDAWFGTGMAAPHVMATATWGDATAALFADGFETGDLSRWSAAVP